MKMCIALALMTGALVTSGAQAQTKAADLLAHCEAAPGGDGFCRGFVEATVDGFILYPEESELDHFCIFKEAKAPTDRLVELSKAALLELTETARFSLNAAVALRTYFREEKNCAPFPGSAR